MALACVGILAIYLAERPEAGVQSNLPLWKLMLTQYHLKQLLFLITGLAMFFFLVALDYRKIGRYSYLFFSITIVLLIAVRFLHVPHVTGTRRWFALGPLRLQPSELAKIAFILALAWYLRFRRNYRTFLGFLLPFTFTLVPMGLIVVQPDLGTSLLFLPTLIAVLFAAGARKRHLMAVVLMGLLSLPLLWCRMPDYQKSRILGWLRQGSRSVRSGPGYHLDRSLIAIGSGGPYGQPWARAEMIENELLVFDHTDFIFAVIAAQTGLVGTSAVLLLYLIIFGFGLRVAKVNYDPFGRLVAVGVVAMLAAQTVVNISMTVGLLPVTGMTLPFVSYGGSSLWACLIALALLINVGKYRPFSFAQRPFEFASE
jgi:rod shape determining protein RodA